MACLHFAVKSFMLALQLLEMLARFPAELKLYTSHIFKYKPGICGEQITMTEKGKVEIKSCRVNNATNVINER